MPQIPFAFQWEIPKNQLTPLKDVISGLFKSRTISNVSGIEYHFYIYPNGYGKENRGKMQIGLYMKFENLKKVQAVFTIFIESANISKYVEFYYEQTGGREQPIVDTKDFYNREKKYFVDGKFIIKVYGNFKFEETSGAIEKLKWNGAVLGDKLWEKDETKDFTISVENKEIKVHKLILDAQSDVFSAMLKPNTKESIESKVQIKDFSFNVVEEAVKLIYDCNFVSTLSTDDYMSLLQFFDKYQIQSLKDKVESHLIDQISAANVCRLSNASILSNSTKLKNKCIESLRTFIESKTALSDLEILPNQIAVQILQNMLYRSL
uniref:BTB domain-containing protein n=1 Tax=Panagrolaimus sp. PS1159 TaxID=55785 RepID=A0AC35F7Y9_9BILA